MYPMQIKMDNKQIEEIHNQTFWRIDTLLPGYDALLKI
jgi:hypothetical protein